jgi:hypothetical protein
MSLAAAYKKTALLGNYKWRGAILCANGQCEKADNTSD